MENKTENTVITEEKKFTQTDVDRIVKERLSRQRFDREKEVEFIKEQQSAELEEKKHGLEVEYSRNRCKQFLEAANYPEELLDVFDTGDYDSFSENSKRLYDSIAARVLRSDTRAQELTRKVIALEMGIPTEVCDRIRGESEEEMRKDAEVLAKLLRTNGVAPLGSAEPVITGRHLSAFDPGADKHEPKTYFKINEV